MSARPTSVGHDVDTRPDQRVELRRPAESGQRHGSGTRLASINRIRVTVTYTSAVVTPAIGASGSPISEADIVGTCKVNDGVGGACNNASGVWATTIANTMDPPLVKPQIDLDWWWRNAKPGPMHPCTEPGNTFPNGFDNDAGATSGNVFAPDNSVNTSAEITPMNASYTCQVKENGVLVGEISWNNATHVLKVFGTIYIDGDIRFDDNGQIVHYQGRAIIYASDDIEFDERVCAGGSGMTNCAASPATMSAWTPSTDLLTILAGDLSTSQPCCPTQENAEFDHSTQGTNSSPGRRPRGTRRVPGDRLREGELPDPRVLQDQRARHLQPDHDRRGRGDRLPDVLGVPAARLAR